MSVRDVYDVISYNNEVYLDTYSHWIHVDDAALAIYGDLEVISIETHPHKQGAIIIKAN